MRAGEDFTILGFAVASAFFHVFPETSVLNVTTVGASKGRLAATVAALGLAVGSTCHAILASIGVTAIFVKSEAASFVIAVVGGVYIIYLGLVGFGSAKETYVVGSSKRPCSPEDG